MDDYITKPVDRERLDACLDRFLTEVSVGRGALEAG